MPNIPCNTKIDCACADSPFANLSSEAPDLPFLWSIGYAGLTPPLGVDWTTTGCISLCQSTVSQQAANLCAEAQALECVVGPWTDPPLHGDPQPVPPPVGPGPAGPPVGRAFNSEQSATVNCPDGLPFTFTVPAGTFFGYGPTGQIIANDAAQSYAQQQAGLHLLCLSNLTVSQVCAGTAYNQTITATGNFLVPGDNAWDFAGGTAPPGLAVNPEFFTGNSMTITGAPTTPGTYTFTICVTAPNGDSMCKPYTIKVAGITNGSSLANGSTGTSYSQPILSAGVTNPIYSLESGSLPDGLSLDSTGVIFGTPTNPGTFNFTLGVTEAGTGLTCDGPAMITIVATGLNFNLLTWTQPTFSNPPSTFGTGLHNHFTGTVTAQAVTGGGIAGWNLGYSGDPLTFTGALAHCNLHLIVSNLADPIGALTVVVVAQQDGVEILRAQYQVNFFTDGTFDFPFTVQAGVNSVVQVAMFISGGSDQSGCSLDGTFTPAF